MTKNRATLDQAQEAYRENPSNATAGEYLAVATEYAADDMISDDTWLDVVSEVVGYLRQTPGWRRA
jgi:hypothetical protein